MPTHPDDLVEVHRLAREVGIVRLTPGMAECLVLLVARIRAENLAMKSGAADIAHHQRDVQRKCGGWKVG